MVTVVLLLRVLQKINDHVGGSMDNECDMIFGFLMIKDSVRLLLTFWKICSFSSIRIEGASGDS